MVREIFSPNSGSIMKNGIQFYEPKAGKNHQLSLPRLWKSCCGNLSEEMNRRTSNDPLLLIG
jgi:hypothetical protein